MREVDRCRVAFGVGMDKFGMSWMKEGEEAGIKRIPSFLINRLGKGTQRGRLWVEEASQYGHSTKTG